MANDNKAVGPLAAARLATLIKAMTAKKYDKTGGKIEGSAEITGGLKVESSSEFSSSIKAGSEISSDMLLMAPIVALYDPATEESISFGVSGENAAKVTSPVSGGGTQYARLAVGTPTGDNDAATKAYVDDHCEVITVTSTEVSDLGYDASEGAHTFAVTFDASFDSILANLAANKSMKFNITIPDDTGGFPLSFTTGYVSALGNAMYEFTGTVAGAPVVLSIGGLGSASVYLYADYLPEPNPDDSDDGKSLVVNGHKWTMKKAAVDDAMSSTSANPVQNKVIKQYVDSKATGSGAVRYDATQELTFEQKQRARNNIEALPVLGATTGGAVSLCPDFHIVDSNAAVHIVPSKVNDEDYTVTLDCGPENWPVRVAGIRTPTDAQTDYAANVAYVKAKIAEVAASGGVDVDNALSATSTNPVQNKVVTAALTGKAGTAVATESANGLMSAADKKKLDRIAEGATKITIDSAMSGSSNNPVANHVVKQYVDDKVASAGSNITVDATLSSTSANPVQNKAVKAAIDAKADKTALDAKADKTALDAKADKTALNAKLDKTGGTLTGNLTGKYITGTWLQSTAASDLGRTPGKIAVLDDSGWVYYRTPAELFGDLGIANAIKSYVDTAIVAAINSAY